MSDFVYKNGNVYKVSTGERLPEEKLRELAVDEEDT